MTSAKLSLTYVLSALAVAGCGGGGGGTDAPSPPDNVPPSVSAVGEQAIDEDGVSEPILFEVGDAETMTDALAVSVSAADAALFPASGIDLAGAGARRSLLLAPAPGVSGATTVTVQVTDADGATASTSFGVTVNPLYRADFEPWMRGVVFARRADDSAVGEPHEDGSPLAEEEDIPRIRFSEAAAEDETSYDDILTASEGDPEQSD